MPPLSASAAAANVLKAEIASALAKCRQHRPKNPVAVKQSLQKSNAHCKAAATTAAALPTKTTNPHDHQLTPIPSLHVGCGISADESLRRKEIAASLCSAANSALDMSGGSTQYDNGRGVYQWLWKEEGGEQPLEPTTMTEHFVICSDDDTPSVQKADAQPARQVPVPHGLSLPTKRNHNCDMKAPTNAASTQHVSRVGSQPAHSNRRERPTYHFNGSSASLGAYNERGLAASIRRLLGGGPTTKTNANDKSGV